MYSPGCTSRSLICPPTRSPNFTVVQLFLGQLVGRAPVLKSCLETANGVERGLVAPPRSLSPESGRFEVLFRKQTFGREALRPRQLGPGIIPIGEGKPDGGNGLVRRRDLDLDAVHLQLRLGLPQYTLSPFQREGQFLRLQPDQGLSGLNLLSQFNQDFTHNARDFTGKPRLTRRDQGPGDVNLTLDLDAPDLRSTHQNWLAIGPAPLRLRRGAVTRGQKQRSDSDRQ